MPPRLAQALQPDRRRIDGTAHQPIIIAGKRWNSALVSEEDRRSIAETWHLFSVPGMRQSIRKGMVTPIAECAKNDSEEMRLYADSYRNQSR